MGKNHKIIKIAPDSEVPSQIYGTKASGYSDLISFQTQSPVPYLVPDAYAVPPRPQGDFTSQDIHDAFKELTRGHSSPAVLMARSSAIDELPGQNPTLFIPFDPKDIEGSSRRFSDSVDQVLSSSDQMGVLLTKMVGDSSTLKDGTVVVGRNNVSFVADSHNPVKPNEMHLALVHGLGTRVVEAGAEFISVAVDRKTGLITHFGEQREAAIVHALNSRGIKEFYEYRQQQCDCWDVKTGGIVNQPIDPEIFEEISPPHIVRGKLTPHGFPGLNDYGPDTFSRFLRFSPFGNAGMFQQLVGSLQYLSSQLGPIQIEGAFPNNNANEMYLYQLISVPEVEVSEEEMKIVRPVMISDLVIGRGQMELPLVILSDEAGRHVKLEAAGFYQQRTILEKLGELDEKFGERGYALVASGHDRELLTVTPYCRVRLFYGMENPSSHPVTLIRYEIDRNPDAGHILAMALRDHTKDPSLKKMRMPDVDSFGISYYNSAEIHSNGRKLMIGLPPPPPSKLGTFAKGGITHTIVGGIPFGVGEYVSNILMGHENPTFPEFVKTYSALAAGGGTGRMVVDGVIRKFEGKPFFNASPFVFEGSQGFAKGFARRSIPLFVALSLADYVKDGKIGWEHLPVAIANIMIASGVTHGLGQVLTKATLVKKIAQALKLIKIGSVAAAPETFGTTLLGACLASIVEFTILKVLGDLEQKIVLYFEEDKLRQAYAEAIHKNNDLVLRQKSGREVRAQELFKIQGELFAAQMRYEGFMRAKIELLKREWGQKRRAIDEEEIELLTRMLDGTWSRAEVRKEMEEERKELREKYVEKIRVIEEGDGKKAKSITLENPKVALTSSSPWMQLWVRGPNVFRIDASNQSKIIAERIKYQVATNLEGLLIQQEGYVAGLNAFWSDALTSQAKALAMVSHQ